MSAAPDPVDPSPIRVPAGTTAQDALKAAGTPLKGPDGAVVVRDLATGDLRDLAWAPETDAEVEPVPAASPEGRAVIRHSTAHVLAQAVQDLFPGTRLGIGPPVENGFYYDFDPERAFTPEDLAALEKRMTEIVRAGQRFARREIGDDDARAELAHEPYKLELIGLKGGAGQEGAVEDTEGADVEVGGAQLTMYDNLDARTGERVWTDLCRGPHLPRTSGIPAFSLTRSAAAYWRGSEKNPQLQRVYGTAWESKDAHKAHLEQLAEAERRDHRRLGAELDLFSFPDEIGSGLPVFHAKGGVVKREMEDYVRRRHIEEGFDYVGTPHVAKGGLFETSGHLPYYEDTMFPALEMDNAKYYLKAMNCPMHNLIYSSRGRSYRDLPLRYFEFGSVYRYEKSGVVHGLTRVRGFAQDDSHSYVTPEQAPGEIRHLLSFVLGLLRDFGMDDYYLELSTKGDDPEKAAKFIGSDEEWAVATAVLEDAAKETGLELVPDPGGAAFYGPKISVQARDAIGRTWQMSTIQYDFNQPARFGLEYTSADGGRAQPVMIHSAKFGSIERFFGVLTEHYAGAFPAWLAPVQVVGIPVTDEQVPYLADVARQLRARGIRVEVDDSDDRMQKKIRTASKQKVPFVLIAGATDAQARAVSFRFRDGSQHNGVPVDRAVAAVADWVAGRTNADPTAEAVVPGGEAAG
ncbi:threonine--tRNA ligase [Geodermatophilus sp. DSM 44513]|uniref:threonine--tRNA ligase n=1 Tax=Geodermatophilus sp. DSM 44513 TaxID=1528104 RepID=UPI00126E927E|nr:threonine--tRNA ligase [Geodermatophilus sp. DSM 44513]WNV77431.1 threonine--tRNA ligase [Geodermatophilus sp. DSM 44513]